MGWIKDAILELRISWHLHRLLSSYDRQQMRLHARRMAELCKQRSPRQVEKMERRANLK